jgi:hypothetical protein
MHQDRQWMIYATVTWVSLVPLVPLWFLLGRAVPPSFAQEDGQHPPGEGALAEGSGSQQSPRAKDAAVSPAAGPGA